MRRLHPAHSTAPSPPDALRDRANRAARAEPGRLVHLPMGAVNPAADPLSGSASRPRTLYFSLTTPATGRRQTVDKGVSRTLLLRTRAPDRGSEGDE